MIDLKTKIKLRKFFNKYPTVKKIKGEILFKPGDKIGDFLLAKSGYVKIYELNKKGEQLVLPVFKPLLLLAMLCLFTKKKNNYYVEAVTNVEYWKVSEAEFLKYLEKDKELKSKLAKYVLMSFSDLMCNYKSLVFGDAKVKITTLLKSLVDAFGRKTKNGLELKFNISHKTLASMTGLSRETVTIQLLKLQKQKVIIYKGRKMIINNLEKLKGCSDL